MKKLFALLVGLLIVGATAGTAMAFPFGAKFVSCLFMAYEGE